jgi:transcriptional antiterminator NusG
MMGDETFKEAWYVVHTKSRFENVVSEGLAKRARGAFLPKIRVQSRRRDRKKMIHIPLFPGYVFVRCTLNPYEMVEVLKTTGVVRFVGSRTGPVAVPDPDIESLQIMISTDLPVTTGTRFKKGDRVMVIAGPFAGVTGIFERYQGQERVMVYVEALGQFAAVEVGVDDVELLPAILT